MPSRFVRLSTPFPWVHVAFGVALTLPLSGWTTCAAIVNLSGCTSAVPPPQISSLLPDTIGGFAQPVPLIVVGTGFVPQSQILWNGSPLPTTFNDSRHLQATITQQTFDSFPVSSGNNVLISVRSPASAPVLGCSSGGDSSTLVLIVII